MANRLFAMQIALCALLLIQSAVLWFFVPRLNWRWLTWWARGLAVVQIICGSIGLAVLMVTATYGAFPS